LLDARARCAKDFGMSDKRKLAPRMPDGMTVGGRDISGGASGDAFPHEIPQCRLIGHAAAVGAAIAAA